MSNASRPVADINITPLIDVMLVLLIIFMVMAPVARRGLDAALPQPAAQGSEGRPPAMMVTVEPSGLRLGATPLLGLADLERELREAMAVRTEKTVFVRASGVVSYARIVDVVDAARGAGAERIGLVPDHAASATGSGR